jgi:putative ABC transport system permease protein
MLKNFILIALRNFKRSKLYSLINLCGLAIGIATAILIFLYVDYETSFDRFHQKSDRIYRIAVDALAGNTVIKQTFNPAPMPAALYMEYSEIEVVCRVADWGDCLAAGLVCNDQLAR